MVIHNKLDPHHKIAGHPLFATVVRILKSAGSREVYVFGSAAHGDIDQANDIDLAISGLPPELFFLENTAIKYHGNQVAICD